MRFTRLLLPLLTASLFLTGCGASTVRSVRPVEALNRALEVPEVAAWYRQHSAPAVTAGLPVPAAHQRWRRYRPAATVDLVKEGLQVRLESRFGPAPRRVEVLVDRRSGAVLTVSPVPAS